jgi:hypothetical protein
MLLTNNLLGMKNQDNKDGSSVNQSNNTADESAEIVREPLLQMLGLISRELKANWKEINEQWNAYRLAVTTAADRTTVLQQAKNMRDGLRNQLQYANFMDGQLTAMSCNNDAEQTVRAFVQNAIPIVLEGNATRQEELQRDWEEQQSTTNN